ncbi:FkbM family methyltransferase (plasmid) [Embleya sp. NBC_00888]|uniref:FkbM family methyltransferase n=1 Tax=Embleya sp. NBC_00888 TaxID=2975960 RepID=UPI00386F5F06|nr:FkbM family methyltransferase [Embleya sp. NBC_00888]
MATASIGPEVEGRPGVMPACADSAATAGAGNDRSSAYATAKALVSSRADWDLLCRGRDPELLQRTVYAFVLALDSGTDDPVVLAPVDGGASRPGFASLPIVAGRSLFDHMRRWNCRPAGESDGTRELGDLRRLIDAVGYPEFTVADGDSPPCTEEFADPPLRCTTTMTYEGPLWTLRAPRERFDEALLGSFLGQAAAVLAAVRRAPATSFGEIAQVVRGATFDVRVITPAGFAALDGALGAWGTTIGLPLHVRHVEPDAAHIPDTGASTLRAVPWGANLVVVAPGLAHLAGDVAMSADRSAGRLPGGLPIAELNANETRELFDEIVVRARYLRGGIRIDDGDLVVDVGANIGLFCLFAASQASGVRIHAFEPAPAAADALETNVRAYNLAAHVERAALGRSDGRRALTYYPRSSLQSGLYADSAADEDVVRGYARRQVETRATIPPELREAVADALAPQIHRTTAAPVRSTVTVRRLSGWIRERGIDRIDLLKIDAERAEEDVLLGIDEAHWPLIGQIVVEVHDTDGRMCRLRALLDAHGFDTVTEQDELFTGSEIRMLYARRPRPARADRAAAPWMLRQIDTAARWAENSALPVLVTVPPGTPDEEAGRVRDEATARGLSWAGPGEGSTTAWAEALLRAMTAADRPVAKAVVVDGDDTLWGGICGEVGPENVRTDGPYRLVQEFLREQGRSGRALVLCSRNNAADLREVFAAHPDMPLQPGDFVAVHTTWGRKSDAVAAIADELGFATESLVFIDDNPAERVEVGLRHPALTVVDVPADPDAVPAALRATWQLALDTPGTTEDRRRTRLVDHERLRREVAGPITDPQAYLRELALEVDVIDATDADAERICQLAARTTQFNLCLRRHHLSGVRRLLAGPGIALAVRARDRFGDYGLVGFASARREDEMLRVRDFFLSCRTLGRNVEWRLLRALGERAAADGLSGVGLQAVTGPRNQPARTFVRAAHARFTAGSRAATAVLDAARVAELDWKQGEIPHTDPHGDRAATGVSDLPCVRWPVSLAAAQRAATTVARPGTQTAPTTVYVPPETAVEHRITAVWEETLGVRSIGVADDLFTLGCDSLTAAVICARLDRIGLRLDVHDLWQHPTIEGVARAARPTPTEPCADAGELEPEPQEQHAPSLGQQRIWVAETTHPHANAQIIPAAHRITGPLDVEALRRAFQDVVTRHPALRTTLTERDGSLHTHVLPAGRFDLGHVDLRESTRRDAETDRAAHAFFDTPFALDRDVLLRATLIRLAPDAHLLMTAVHHSACDGWSLDLLNRDLSAAYAGPQALAALPEPTPFAHYQRKTAHRLRHGKHQGPISEILAALEPTPRAAGTTPYPHVPAPRHHRFALDLALTHLVRNTARTYATTPFHLYLAAYQLLLAAAFGTDTPVSGCPVANRHDPAHADTVGFLANLVPVPAHIDWSTTLGRHLAGAVETSTRALRHADLPYALLTRARPQPGGLFDNLFTLQPPPTHRLEFRNCSVERAEPVRWPLPYPLMLDLQEHADGASALLRFDALAAMPVPADTIAEAYPLFLNAACALPGLPLERLRTSLRPPRAAVEQLVRRRLKDLDRQEGTADA